MHLTTPPESVKKFHAYLLSKIEDGDEKRFTVSQRDELLVRVALYESSWMMQAITLLDVNEIEGAAYNIGGSGLFTGRGLEKRFKRTLPVNGTPYSLVETDSCASMTYEQMSLIANFGSYEHFENTVSRFFNNAFSLDMLRVGFNGEGIAVPTNPTANPKGQDINIGWHTLAKEFNDGSQVITEPLSLGEGGDYPHLDALANKLIKEKIPEAYREDPRLVVLVGAELAAAHRLKLFNVADRPADLAAAQMLNSSVASRFAFVPPFMPGKRLAVTTLENLHIYTQANTRYFRAEFVDDREDYEHAYLRNEGYALGNGYLYAAVDESAVTLAE